MKQRNVRRFTLLTVGLGSLLLIIGGLGIAQNQEQQSVQEVALIHSLTVGAGEGRDAPALFPNEIRVKVGQLVRLFNVTPDPSGLIHDPVIISSDEDGKSPVFGVQGFRIEPGKITVVEFTPDRSGTFFITHKVHFHDIVGQLIVEE